MTGRLLCKNNRYYVVISYKDTDSKFKQKWISTGLLVKNNKRRAEKIMHEKLLEFSHALESGKMSSNFAEYIGSWLELKQITLSPNTYESYRTIFNAHICKNHIFLKKELRDITSSDLQSYYLEQIKSGRNANTIIKHNAVLNGALRYATTQGLIDSNPLDKVTLPPKSCPPVRYFSNEQIQQILNIVRGTQIETPVYLAVFSGFRRSEVLGLRWNAIDFQNKVITMNHTVVKCGNTVLCRDRGKSASSIRSIFLSEPLLSYLKLLFQKRITAGDSIYDYICKKPNGELLKPEYLSRTFRRIIETDDLPMYSFHSLRHSSATFLLSNGFQLREIQGWLGHKSFDSTNIYAHLQYCSIIDMSTSFNKLSIKKETLLCEKVE